MNILPFLRIIYPKLTTAIIYIFLILISVFFIKKIKIKINSTISRSTKLTSILKYFILWFFSILAIFLIVDVVGFKVARFVFSCPKEVKSFTYDSCSVQYTEYKKDGTCIPEGIRMLPPPEMTGSFEINRKIEILECLCSKDKYQSAFEFRNEYLIPDTVDSIENACKNIPEGFYYTCTPGGQLS